jgi:hypothetical protein
MSEDRSVKFTFWQVIISSLITAVVSISVALINTRSEASKSDAKIETLDQSNQQLRQRIKEQDDTLKAIHESVQYIQQQVNQQNVHGSNFAGDQNNNGKKH